MVRWPGKSRSLGSSPRVRGKGHTRRTLRGQRRIIPAGAGKSLGILMKNSSCKDHPRGCGEKFPTTTTYIHLIGSSPRVRGKELLELKGLTKCGIIPAGAGKR